ncbi:Ribonuclease P protein subunit p29 [Trichinella pseudospiralis]|uniref:Ribonuclease P protein subunit p29 n=1 Tax=Trichinella pseudospiralis TaxID=6337 RepID=A0A0V1G0E6_TRIPS|nr:Ribonuclease P protein subunit p29 [Trichinella pseudospiralis]
MSATDTKKEEESEYCVVSEAEDCFTDDELSRSTEAQNVKSCNELKRIGSDLEEGELLELEEGEILDDDSNSPDDFKFNPRLYKNEDISNECTTTTIHPERVQASPLSKYCCKDPEYKSDYKCYGRINSGDARRNRDFNSEFRSRNSGSEETWKRSGHGNHYENYRSSHVNNSGESSRSRWRTERSENVFRDRDDYRGDYGEPNRNHSRARSPLHRSVSGGRPLPYSRPSYDESTSYDRRDSWHRESSYKRSRRAYESGNDDSPSRRRRHTPSYFYGSDSSSSSIERPSAKLRRLSKERSTTSRSSIRSNHPESLSSYKSERSVSRSASPPYSERRKSFSRSSTSSDSSSLSKVDVRLTAKAVRAVLRRNVVHSNSSTGENSEYESEKSDESDVDEEEIEEVEEDEIDEEERKEKEEEEEEEADDDDDDDNDEEEEEEEEEDDDDEDDGDDDSNEKRRQHSANAVSHEAPLTTLNDSKRREVLLQQLQIIEKAIKEKKRMKRRRKRRKRIFKRLYKYRDFKNLKLNYEQLKPLHDLWKKYILSLGSDECLLKADYHGAVLLVSHSKCQSQVGLFGIVVIETKHAFLLLTPKDRLLTIPKKGSIFTFVLKGHVYSLIGDHICYTAAGRVQKKFKLAHLTSMPDFIDDLLPHVN